MYVCIIFILLDVFYFWWVDACHHFIGDPFFLSPFYSYPIRSSERMDLVVAEERIRPDVHVPTSD